MYSYSVKLVGLQSTDYSTSEVKTVDGDEYTRFYEPPSVMFAETAPAKPQKRQNNKNHCLDLYALEERKILSPEEAAHLQLRPPREKSEGRRKRFLFTKDKQKKFVQKHYSEGDCPNFICNLSTLNILMTQHTDFKLIATKVQLENGESFIYLKYLNFIQESNYRAVGYLVENVLAVNSVEDNHVLEAIYQGTLTKSDENGSKDFKIGFIGETDGIWSAAAKEKEDGVPYEAKDLAEVKSVGTAKFYWPRQWQPKSRSKRKNTKLSHYYYEEDVLRRYWAQCRLRGIEKLLCAVVQGARGNEVMKEIWMYNVNRIPGLLKKENKNARPFPKVDFKNFSIPDKEKYTELHQTLNWKEWTEETEFRKLFTMLNQISKLFDENDRIWTRHFIFEKEDSRQGLKPVSSSEFEEC